MGRQHALTIVNKWDNGEFVDTLTMGGLGPGYEQALQVAAIEFLRASLRKPDMTREQWQAHCYDVLAVINAPLGGLSGSQLDAAVALSWLFYELGEDGLNNKARVEKQDDRFIMVSKRWPDADAARRANVDAAAIHCFKCGKLAAGRPGKDEVCGCDEPQWSR